MSEIFYYIFLTLSAILPPLIFLTIIWIVDKIEKEPKLIIFALFSLGALSCIPIAFTEIILGFFNFFTEDTLIYAFVDNFAVVAFSEEMGKFIILFLITWFSKHFNYKYDAIVYAVAVSLGFATLENILYVLSSQLTEQNGLEVAILRMLLAIPGHFTDGVFMGLFYGIAKEFHHKKKTSYTILTLFASCFVPICIHGFYDFCLSASDIFMLIFIPFIIIVDVIAIILIIVSIKTDKMLHNPYLNTSIYKNVNIQKNDMLTNYMYNKKIQNSYYMQQPYHQNNIQNNNTFQNNNYFQ